MPEHDPEKWDPVFGKDHASIKCPWRMAPDGLLVAVRVTPKAGRDAIEGIAELGDGTSVLKVRLRAAPSEGEANAALIRHLAAALKVPPRDVSLLAGARGRIKRLKIAGPAADLAASLAHVCALGPARGKPDSTLPENALSRPRRSDGSTA
jgi:uncharacterized protein (TIGR00251 family)